MTAPIDRRSAVRTLGAAGAALAPYVAQPGLPSVAHVPLERWLRTMLADLDSARRVGQAYLAKAPDEASRDRLMAQLFPRLDPGGAQITDRPESWRESFAMRCRRDFVEGQTVRVDGWVLSLTEVRLCALASLA